AKHRAHRPGDNVLQGLVAARDKRLAFELDRDLAAESALKVFELGEDRPDLGQPVGQVLAGLGADLDAHARLARVGRVIGAAGDGPGVEHSTAVQQRWLPLKYRLVEPVQPGDHLGQVHDRVNADVRLAAVRGHAVGNDVNPAETLMLDDQLVRWLRLDHNGR